MTDKWHARQQAVEDENEQRRREIEQTKRLERAVILFMAACILLVTVWAIWVTIQ